MAIALNIFLLIANVVISSTTNLSTNGLVTETNSIVQEKICLQYLDHFNSKDKRLWNQRYFVNEEFYVQNKTKSSFLYIGGEGIVNGNLIKKGAVYEIAKKYGGILFLLEHRFYGASQPFDDLRTSNLEYLTSMQALHDLANFIIKMNDMYKFGKDVKWITIGGSYSGSLAVWIRLKFPHLVHGAVASSAPLYAQLKYPEYLETVSKDIAVNGEECIKNVNTAFKQLEDIFENKTNHNITSIFNLCSEFKTPLSEMDKVNLYEYIIDHGFANIAQTHKLNITMHKACDVMKTKSIGTELERLGNVMLLIKGEECFEAHWDKYVLDLKNDTIDDNLMMRQWWYQTCTEFGWYQITDNSSVAFGNRIPLEYFLNLCNELYGEDIDRTYIENQVKETNIRYGGKDIDISNLILLQGSLDPWHRVGMYEGDILKHYTVIFIEGVTHCADLSTASEDDPVQLKNAREKVLTTIGAWVGSTGSTISKTISKVMMIVGVFSALRTR